jgi:hypothetical protein
MPTLPEHKEYIVDEFESGDLNEYGEEGRRLFAMTLMDIYVPSAVGSIYFTAIAQGRAEAAQKTKSFFSTCGELGMFLLHQMGYRGPILNRTLLQDRDGEDRKYRWGQNMARLYGAAREHGHFVDFKDNTPKPGDICFVSNGPPKSEHVFVFKGQYLEGEATYWESYDAGQTTDGKKWNQCSKICRRRVVGRRVGDRTCYGWVDISSVPLVAKATLDSLELWKPS